MTELREGTPDLNSFWPMVRSICAQLKRHYNTDDLRLAERLILRAEDCTSVLRAIYGRVFEVLPGSGILHDILFVIGELQNYCQHYCEWTLRDERDHPRLPIQPDCPVQHTSALGAHLLSYNEQMWKLLLKQDLTSGRWQQLLEFQKERSGAEGNFLGYLLVIIFLIFQTMNLMLLSQAYCRLALVTLVDNVSSSRGYSPYSGQLSVDLPPTLHKSQPATQNL